MINNHLLAVNDLHVKYGEGEVLHGIDLFVDKGETVTIIGANGSGKTTLLKAISGLIKSSSGAVMLGGESLMKKKAYQIRRMGLAFAACRGILRDLSVQENLTLAASLVKQSQQKKAIDTVYSRFPRLRERHKQTAASLSGGEQQMLAIALGLLGEPQCLMLDEPSLGLAPLMVAEVFEELKSLKEMGVTLMVVEQNAKQALNIADRAYVLELGKIVAEGKTADITSDTKIVEAYLGI